MTGQVQTIRLFILIEAASFVVASLIHSGMFISGHEHQQARIAEGVIGGVLSAGLILSFVRPTWTRWAGIAVQSFALLGTLIGLFTIAIGIGPRTTLDLVYHPVLIAILVWGLMFTVRARFLQPR
jgi:hypothetical protein